MTAIHNVIGTYVHTIALPTSSRSCSFEHKKNMYTESGVHTKVIMQSYVDGVRQLECSRCMHGGHQLEIKAPSGHCLNGWRELEGSIACVWSKTLVLFILKKGKTALYTHTQCTVHIANVCVFYIPH